ncbi:MAG: FHA domain-containing protein, partial [Planctomycetota bacterium]
MANLVIKDTQNGTSTKIRLTLDRLRIGKKEGKNDLVLARSSVSRQHCEIVKDNGRYIIRDLGSSNGTFLNGKKITEAPLGHNNRIRIGDFEIIYQEDGKPEDAPPEILEPPTSPLSTVEKETSSLSSVGSAPTTPMAPATPKKVVKKKKRGPIPVE